MPREKEKHGKEELKEWQKKERQAAKKPRYRGAWESKKDFRQSLDLAKSAFLVIGIIFGFMLLIGLYFADNAPTKIGWTAENTPGIISVTVLVAILFSISLISGLWLRHEEE
jgi:hypothetical protein